MGDTTSRLAVRAEGVSVTYGDQLAVRDASIDIAPGEIVALLGPSGCGKTSMLRALAGLERPTSGCVTIGDRIVSDGRTWVRPEHRQVGMVFQDGALFPHLTVSDNIAFGLGRTRSRASDQRRRHDRVAELLDLVDLAGVGDRLPGTLSGGQRQRIALARSLAPQPGVLLLDEPFSALDAGLRVQVRSEVVRILREVGVTAVFVTHDQDEAFVVGDRVAVMHHGRIEQVGRPGELYRQPVSPWVAHFVGEANLVAGVRRTGTDLADTSIGPLPLAPDTPSDERVQVLVRPEQIALEPGDDAEVVDVEYYGHDVRYVVRVHDGTTLAVRAHPDHVAARGDRRSVTFRGEPTVAWSGPDTDTGVGADDPHDVRLTSHTL